MISPENQYLRLLQSAELAVHRAYAPYSGVHVGAAVQDSTGKQFLGANIENASYGLTCCAERGADDAVLRKARGKRASYKYHSLGAAKTDRHMEPFFIEIYPDEEAAAEKPLSSHEGEEFIVVVSGELEVIVGPDRHVLGAGDSVYFNSVVPHYVGCGNAPKTDIYAVLYIPQ